MVIILPIDEERSGKQPLERGRQEVLLSIRRRMMIARLDRVVRMEQSLSSTLLILLIEGVDFFLRDASILAQHHLYELVEGDKKFILPVLHIRHIDLYVAIPSYNPISYCWVALVFVRDNLNSYHDPRQLQERHPS